MTADEVVARFAAEPLDDEAREYLRYHARRYAQLVDDVAALVPEGGRILDIGPNFQTGLLRAARADARVDTLGFAHPLFGPGDGERHVELDLNRADDPATPRGEGAHDVAVMAEVIEHLPTSPVVVLRFLATFLRPGGMLLVQTPNAVALHKRVRLLTGRPVLEPIRESRDNPGHFHEYTVGELREAATAAGLEVTRWRATNPFGTSRPARAYAAVARVLPRSLRHGLTVWMRRPISPSATAARTTNDGSAA